MTGALGLPNTTSCSRIPPRRNPTLVRDQRQDRRRLADEIDHAVKAMLAGTPYLQRYREAYNAIPVLDVLAESARSGRPVALRR
ncbi:hypothetical protein PZN02_005397 [Sinorhizobium garamanticum]|uniref:Uncharacterized protein n=1 Tax=Sinorhizobium garamanticum TaxID=680247 RepID=A0ABY8DGM5_9HYPH|nr:hypothetical protein [Sinorhizobium garamanticum]WEX90050.1 hypothetical protein PZN02_005397 [Sinorhizobium garamanticum]